MKKICLVAVDVRSSHNVGSLFRSCDGFGAELVLVGISPRPLDGGNDMRLPHVAKKANHAIAKVALGAENTVTWQYFAAVDEAFDSLRKHGYSIVAIEQSDKSKSIKYLKPKKPLAIVVGPELKGLDEKTLSLCDEIYEIPMSGKKESLNVSVAAAVALYQASLSDM